MRAVLVASLLLASGLAAWAYATRDGDANLEPDIRFERATLVSLPGRLDLDARADIELPDTVRAGLDSGVPLDFVVTLDVSEPRRWWFDAHRLDARWHFRLEYYELTRHYRLADLDTGKSRNYRSLLRALDSLGTLRGLDVGAGSTDPDVARAAREGGAPPPVPAPGAEARLSMRLDIGALPLPLQPLTSSSWRVRDRAIAWRIEGA